MSTRNAAEQAIAQIEQQFQQALSALQAIEDDVKQESTDLKNAAYDKSHFHSYEHRWSGGSAGQGGGEVTVTITNHWATNGYNEAMADYTAKSQDIKNQRAILKGLGSQFDSLCDAITNLMAMMANLVKNSNVGGDLVSSDLSNISKAMQELFASLKAKIEATKYQNEMGAAISNGMSGADVGQYISEMVSYQNEEDTDLTAAGKDLKALLPIYRQQYLQAEEDKDKYTIWDKLASPFNGCAGKINHDEAVMDNANAMMNGIETVLGNIAAESSTVMAGFTAVVDEILVIVHEVKAFIAELSSASPEQKEADFKKILADVMYVLSQVEILKQKIENEKAKNNQNMSQGTIAASKDNVEEVRAQQIIKAELEHAAAVAKITMIVVTAVMGAAMMIASGGIGSAFLIGACTAYEELNTAGTIHTNEQLGDAMHSQIGADIVLGVTEGLVTFGAGSALDNLAAKVLESSAKAAAVALTDSAEETLAKEADQIAERQADLAMSKVEAPAANDVEGQAAYQQMRQQFYEEAYTKAYDSLKTTLLKAVEKATVRTSQMFLKQEFGTMIDLAAKREFTQTLERLMEQSGEEAIEDTLEEARTLAKLAARGVESSDGIVEGIADRNANNAVSKISGKTAEDVERVSSNMGWGYKQLMALILAGMLNNNMLSDTAKKMGANDDAWYVQLIAVLQQLMQLLCLAYGSGQFQASTMDGVMSKLPRFANLLSTAPQGVQAINDVGLFQTYNAQAGATTKLARLEGESTLLNDFLQMLQKDSQSWDNMVKEIEQDRASTSELAGHMSDGEQAEISVLISGIG
ncbi:MAG: hypothetical protein K1X28_05585 [Parachlamydiales bacterium]|nr:hypothetical protein [Parachlamydiales bacterium]